MAEEIGNGIQQQRPDVAADVVALPAAACLHEADRLLQHRRYHLAKDVRGPVQQLQAGLIRPHPAVKAVSPRVAWAVGDWGIATATGDGGATWGADQFLGYGRKDNNDPQIEVAGDGSIYSAWMNDYTLGVKFAKSSDHGVTWSTSIALIAKAGKPTWSDKPILAISPSGKDVYIFPNRCSEDSGYWKGC